MIKASSHADPIGTRAVTIATDGDGPNDFFVGLLGSVDACRDQGVDRFSPPHRYATEHERN